METLVKISPKQTVSDIYAAFGRGDIATILSHLSPDVAWNAVGKASNLPYAGFFKGVTEVPKFFMSLNDTFETTDFQVHEMYQNNNVVTVYGLHAVKGRKSGVSTKADWAMRWEFNDDGQVVKYNNYFDTGAIAIAL